MKYGASFGINSIFYAVKFIEDSENKIRVDASAV